MGEGFPLWSLAPMAWEGREPLRDWIYLSVSAFSASTPSPFPLYLEIRNSDWGESFAQIFLIKLAFLRQKEEHQPPYGVPTRVQGAPTPWGAPPASWTPRASSRVDSFSQKSNIFEKKSPKKIIAFGLCLIWIFCDTKTSNKQELTQGTG